MHWSVDWRLKEVFLTGLGAPWRVGVSTVCHTNSHWAWELSNKCWVPFKSQQNRWRSGPSCGTDYTWSSSAHSIWLWRWKWQTCIQVPTWLYPYIPKILLYVYPQGKGRRSLGGRVSSCEGKVKTRGGDQGSASGSTRLHPLSPPHHQVLSNHLAPRIPHLMDSSEDFNARNEAFWFRGGIGPDKSMIKKREGRRNFEEKEFRDKVIQFLQQISPTLTILGCNRANVACRGSKKDWHWRGGKPSVATSLWRYGEGDHGAIWEGAAVQGRKCCSGWSSEARQDYSECLVSQVRCSDPIPAWVERDDKLVTETQVH